jgi:hypothetical protein
MAINEVLARAQASGAITAADALAVRHAVYGDKLAVTSDEMETMLAIDEAATQADPTWTQLLTEAGADFIVNQLPPAGYVTDENAAWLVQRIAMDGVVKTKREFELLVHVVEEATSAPRSLAALALRQVELAVTRGEGPLAGNGLERGRMSRGAVEMLRRITFAFGGNGVVGVTRSEAEILFDLNDATATADNDPSWNDLFVKAIASHVMAVSGVAPPSREQVLADERWLDSPAEGLGGFFARMTAGGLQGILTAYRSGDGGSPDAADGNVGGVASVNVIAEDGAAWLAERFGREGTLKANEKALLRFIRDEAPIIPQPLRSLIDKAA